MTILYHSSRFRDHQTGRHPENPQRLGSIEDHLREAGWFERCTEGSIATIDLKELSQTHAMPQIQRASSVAAAGGGSLDPDTIVSADSYAVALMAAGTATAAVDAVMTGVDTKALCLLRPPGHHATGDRSMGFCLFNNVAVAARHAQARHAAAKILIVDWDVHHGNGTQDIFYEDASAFFFSIHRYPFYPGSGGADEVGAGAGRGATLNVPVTFGTSRQTYLDLFRGGLERAATLAKPDLILLSAGFDAHAADPVGNLGLESEDFGTMTRMLMDVASTYCGGRIVSCLEGGYNLEALAASVGAHLAALAGP